MSVFVLDCLVIELYWNFKFCCLHFFSKFELPNWGCGLQLYLWVRVIHGLEGVGVFECELLLFFVKLCLVHV